LEEEGYWVRQHVKVHEITKEDKRNLGRYSMPTPEIDIVALNMKENVLLLVEVKSLLDSYGVWYDAISGIDKNEDYTKRYRLFWDSNFRGVITERLRQEYLKRGLINENTKIACALAAGNIRPATDEARIREYFAKEGRDWKLFSPEDIKSKIRKFSEKGWEDNLVVMTAKLTKEAVS
jgi:hypothetical protein